MTIKRSHFIIFCSFVATIGVWLLWSHFFPDPKPHPPVRTFATWFVNPKEERDTSTIVFRLDYDTAAPYKRWTPRYYVPLRKVDTLKRAGLKDSVIIGRAYGLLTDTTYLIYDYNKHY